MQLYVMFLTIIRNVSRIIVNSIVSQTYISKSDIDDINVLTNHPENKISRKVKSPTADCSYFPYVFSSTNAQQTFGEQSLTE